MSDYDDELHEFDDFDEQEGGLGGLGDDALRAEFDRTYPTSNTALAALEEIQPRIVQARRRRQMGQTLAAAAAVLAIGGGVMTLTPLGDASSDLVVADGGLDVDGVAADADVAADSSIDESQSSGPADAESGASSQAMTADETAQPAGDQAQADPAVDGDQGAGTATPGLAPTSPTQPPATSPESTVPPTSGSTPTTVPGATTSSLAPGTTLESPCGILIYEVDGRDISLVEVVADDEAQVEVKNPGPEQLEVSLEFSSDNCELKVERSGGEWKATAEND